MKAEDKILSARTALLWDQPFFGALAVQLNIVDATDDPRIDTMATDGRNLYFDRAFVENLTKDELIFVMAHEVLHNAFEHHTRRQNRDHRLFNVACDYAINGELVETKVGKMPAQGLLEARFTGLGAEEIYRILDQERQAGGGNGKGSAPGGGQSNDPGGCGGVLDAAPAHDEAALAEARVEMQTQVRQAAAIAKAAQAGKLPAGVQRIIDQLLKPKVDWRQVLRRFVDESSTRDFSWAKPNRRFLPLGHIMPGTVSDGVSHIVIAVDTSGSIDQQILAEFAAEIRSAFEEGAVDRITVIYADARVAHIEEFETGDELALNAAGGGGTAFSDTFRTIDEKYPDARAAIYLTDLLVSDFGEEPPMPVLWGVYGDSRSFDQLAGRVPFGETISLAA